MEKQKAIPMGYMTVGELAQKMGVTVRTLQHYHRQGLLIPSAVSEGGRRLYTERDVVKLHQILSLKSLGFSLDAIKNRLIPLNTPKDVASALNEQASLIRSKINSLSKSLKEIEMLREEVLQMREVNFKTYADIIINLQMKNDYYWLIKHFDEELLDHIRSRFDQKSGISFMENFLRLQKQAVEFSQRGVLPKSKEGQRFAKEYWEMIMEFTGGDLTMLTKLMEFGHSGNLSLEWAAQQDTANVFLEPALEAYLSGLGINPFEKGER